MKRLLYELKIIGTNPIWISIFLISVYALLSFFGGDLLNLSYFGFEVIFPFYAAIAVGEWGKTRADANFDIIASQGNSLFSWIVYRFTAVFLTICLFAFAGMVIVSLIRDEMPLWEMLIMYFAPAFCLSTLCSVFSLAFKQEHISTLACGVIWLFEMLARSLLRFDGVEYFYLFIRYTGDTNKIWPVNKIILIVISLFIWGIIYLLCKKRK